MFTNIDGIKHALTVVFNLFNNEYCDKNVLINHLGYRHNISKLQFKRVHSDQEMLRNFNNNLEFQQIFQKHTVIFVNKIAFSTDLLNVSTKR